MVEAMAANQRITIGLVRVIASPVKNRREDEATGFNAMATPRHASRKVRPPSPTSRTTPPAARAVPMVGHRESNVAAPSMLSVK